MNAFNLDYLLNTLSPNTVTLGVRASVCAFGRGSVQSMEVSTKYLLKYNNSSSVSFGYGLRHTAKLSA